MNEERLLEIVQEMIDNNEPDTKIQDVVRQAREMMKQNVSSEKGSLVGKSGKGKTTGKLNTVKKGVDPLVEASRSMMGVEEEPVKEQKPDGIDFELKDITTPGVLPGTTQTTTLAVPISTESLEGLSKEQLLEKMVSGKIDIFTEESVGKIFESQEDQEDASYFSIDKPLRQRAPGLYNYYKKTGKIDLDLMPNALRALSPNLKPLLGKEAKYAPEEEGKGKLISQSKALDNLEKKYNESTTLNDKEKEIKLNQLINKRNEITKQLSFPEKPGFWESTGNLAARGFNSFGKGVANLAEMGIISAHDQALKTHEILRGEDIDPEARKSLLKNIKSELDSNLGIPAVDIMNDIYTSGIEQFDEESITDEIGKGNISNAVKRIVYGVVESAPSLLLASTGVGGIVALGASAAGNSFDENFEESIDDGTSMNTLVFSSMGSGAIEAGFELVTRGVMKKANLLVGEGSEKAARELVDSFGKKILKQYAIEPGKEGLSEAATELSNDMWKAATLGQEFDISKSWKNYLDAGLIGVGSGASIVTSGHLKNSNQAVQEAARYKLMPDSDKKIISQSAENINDLNSQLKQIDDSDLSDADKKGQAVTIIEEMKSQANDITKIKARFKQDLNLMNPDELLEYGKNADKINKAKDGLNSPSIFYKNKSEQEISKATADNENFLRESANRRLTEQTETVGREAKKIGKTANTLNTSKEYQEAYDNTEIGKKNSMNVTNSDGFFDPNGDIYINKEVAQEVKAVNVAAHELLHGILRNSFTEPGSLNKVVNEFKSVLPVEALDLIDQRINNKYRYESFKSEDEISPEEKRRFKTIKKNDDGTVTAELKEEFYNEEYMTAFADLIGTRQIKFNENIFQKIGGFFTPIFKGKGYSRIEFNTGKDVYDFVKNYQQQIEKGELKQDILDVAKEGVTGKLITDTKTDTKIKDQKKSKEKTKATKKVDFSKSIVDETSDNKKVRQDTRNTVFGNIYQKYAKGKTKQQWKEFVESPEGLALVQDEILAGTTILDKDNNILEYGTRAEKKALLQKSGNKEVQTSFIPDMIAIAIRKGSSDPTGTAYAGIDFLMNHVKAFNPQVNNDLAGYIGGYLGLKVGSGFNKMQKKGDEISMEKEGVKEIVEKQEASESTTSTDKAKPSPQFFIKDRLGDKAKAIDKKVKAMASNLKLKGKGYKQTPKLVLKETVEMFMSNPEAVYIDDGGSFWKTPKGKKALGTSIAESILNKIENNAALNGQDIKAVQQFLNTNRQSLLSGALAEGTDPSGKSTGMAKVLLDKFYSKGGRVKSAKTGSTQGLAKQSKIENIDDNVYNELFGITKAGTPNTQNVSISSQPVKAIIRATEKIIVNQALREAGAPAKMGEGKSRVMFSESGGVESFSRGQRDQLIKVADAYDINAAGVIAGIPKGSITVNDSNRKQKQDSILQNIKDFALSLNVFESSMPASAGAVRARVGDVSAEANKLKKYLESNPNLKAIDGDVWYRLTDGSFAKGFDKKRKGAKGEKDFGPPVNKEGKPLTNLVADRGKLYYGTSDPAYKLAKAAAKENTAKNALVPKKVSVKERITKAFIEKFKSRSKDNMKVLEEVAFELNDAVNNGIEVIDEVTGEKKIIKMPVENAALIIAQGYQATGGLIKISSPFAYVSEEFLYGPDGSKQGNKNKRPFIEEHNPPASTIGGTLIWAIANNKTKEVFPFIKKNYYQTQLSKADDYLLDMAKLDKRLPKDTSILDDSIIRLASAGINLNKIINPLTGKSIIQEFGLGVDSKFKNDPNIAAYQNELVKEIVLNGLDINIAKARLKESLPVEVSKNKTNQKVNVPLVDGPKVMNTRNSFSMTSEDVIGKATTLDEALRIARNPNAPVKKIRVFDFDDTLARTKSNVLYTMPDGTTGKLTAEEFAQRGDEMLQDGAVYDFSEFNKVMDGKKGPLFEAAKRIQEARGADDIFVLTARAQEASPAIKEFLDSIGLNIPLNNISGLGDSSPFAKSNWIVDKAAEGYNDFYFADDQISNVKAVRDALEVLDVKSKTQQAKIKFSENMNEQFNIIIEQSKGIDRFKIYSDVKAQLAGARKGRFKFFIPPSAEDFQGLLYATLGKGKQGEAHMRFYDQALLKPYAQAMENLSADRVALMNDFKALKKELDVPKDLRKKTKSGFTNEQAVRVYLWAKTGQDIPGLSKKDFKELNDIIENDPKLKVFADQMLSITKGDGYSNPGEAWQAGTITTDLIELLNTTKRSKYLETWSENIDTIFSKENINKLEVALGSNYVEALKNSISRMKAGRNRINGGNRLSDRVLNYINQSTGAIMFFNMRSALLQTISAANFVNWSFNNPLKAGKAFANQPQYWKDFTKLMNSEYLLDRRNGLKLNISESEIADAAKTSKNKAKAALNYIIEKGYIPTKFADSFAIASGGATFYRNKINDLMKNEGKTLAEAEEIAMKEFRKISEISQQSSDPSMISQQQSTDLGRVVLQFVNTPMQYARIQKKAAQDIINGRGDNKTNVSKIIYYAFLQNLIFNALQSGLFAMGFGDDDDELSEGEEKKIFRAANGMMDSWLRGLGFAGVTIQVLKNLGIDIYDRSQKDRPEYSDAWQTLLQFSPAIKSKLSKLKGAGYPFDSKKRRQEIFDKGFSLDNPAYESLAKVITATTNVPLDRLFTKVNNIKGALEEDQETWKSVAMLLGWPEWQLEDKKDSKPKTPKEKAVSKEEKKKARYKAAIGSTDYDTIKDLTAPQQIKLMKSLGIDNTTIKKAKSEDAKIKIIIKKNSGEEPTEEEKKEVAKQVKFDEYKSLTKKDQVEKLLELGLTKAEIRALKYEEDRVKKLLELEE